MIQVKISQDINKYESKTFWGFSPRQLGFTVLAVAFGLIINFGLSFIQQDIRGFITMAIAVPCVGCGWIKLQGMHFEKYMVLFFKSNFENNKRVFMNENLIHYIELDKRAKTNKKRRIKHKSR